MSDYYLCPEPFAQSTTPDKYLGWAKECIQTGKSYLRLQPAFPYIQDGMDIVNGDWMKGKTQTLSDVKTETVVRNLKELVAAQTNIRIIPAFNTDIEQFRPTQKLLNDTYMAWQTMTFADRVLRKAWQYAVACGTGYLGIRWDKDYWYKGKGDIVLDSYGPLDVLPIGMPKSHSLQKSYCVAVKVETPWHTLVSRYPEFRDKIRPSRDNAKGRGTVISQAVKYATAALRRFGPGSGVESESAPWAMCDVYYLYIDDESINKTGRELFMGDPGTSWEYRVPYFGQDIVVNKLTGETRKATEEDCRLYPNRRLIVCTEDVCLTPDPSRQVNPWFHGKVPIVQLRADDWAWGFLGFPLTKAGISLEKANIEMLRGTVDSFNTQLSPPRAYDRNTMSQALASTINTRVPNQVIGLDLTFAGDKQMQPLLPAEFYRVPAIIPEFIEQNEGRITKQMGVADATALARARQLPSGDSVERIMEMMGPLIKDQSRNMEESIRDLGDMWKSLVFQFYNANRTMQLLGPDGVVEQQFEFKIGSLIPDQVPGVLPEDPQYKKARQHALNFTFSVTPYSLHEINSVTRQLFYLQLVRSGFPIDWWTLAEVFNIKNFGDIPRIPQDPDDPNSEQVPALTILDRWLSQKEIEVRIQLAAQQSMAAAGAGPGGPGGPGGGPSGVPGHGPAGPHPPGSMAHPTGRPPTAQNPPSLEMKGDGRPIVRESKK